MANTRKSIIIALSLGLGDGTFIENEEETLANLDQYNKIEDQAIAKAAKEHHYLSMPSETQWLTETPPFCSDKNKKLAVLLATKILSHLAQEERQHAQVVLIMGPLSFQYDQVVRPGLEIACKDYQRASLHLFQHVRQALREAQFEGMITLDLFHTQATQVESKWHASSVLDKQVERLSVNYQDKQRETKILALAFCYTLASTEAIQHMFAGYPRYDRLRRDGITLHPYHLLRATKDCVLVKAYPLTQPNETELAWREKFTQQKAQHDGELTALKQQMTQQKESDQTTLRALATQHKTELAALRKEINELEEKIKELKYNMKESEALHRQTLIALTTQQISDVEAQKKRYEGMLASQKYQHQQDIKEQAREYQCALDQLNHQLAQVVEAARAVRPSVIARPWSSRQHAPTSAPLSPTKQQPSWVPTFWSSHVAPPAYVSTAYACGPCSPPATTGDSPRRSLGTQVSANGVLYEQPDGTWQVQSPG
jgi:hypothetical protein